MLLVAFTVTFRTAHKIFRKAGGRLSKPLHKDICLKLHKILLNCIFAIILIICSKLPSAVVPMCRFPSSALQKLTGGPHQSSAGPRTGIRDARGFLLNILLGLPHVSCGLGIGFGLHSETSCVCRPLKRFAIGFAACSQAKVLSLGRCSKALRRKGRCKGILQYRNDYAATLVEAVQKQQHSLCKAAPLAALAPYLLKG